MCVCVCVVCRYKEAALTYYQSQLSFEEVALKFLQVEGNDALKTFLRKKLEDLSSKVRPGGLSSNVKPGAEQ